MRTQQGSSSHVQVQRVDVIITVSTGRCRPGVVSTGFYRRPVRRGSIRKHVISLRADREFARSSSVAINTTITLSTAISPPTKPTRCLPFCRLVSVFDALRLSLCPLSSHYKCCPYLEMTFRNIETMYYGTWCSQRFFDASNDIVVSENCNHDE